MPAPDLIPPGFYGKLPSTGDFVTRRLRQDFVRHWDRWLARHLVPMIHSGTWLPEQAIFFLMGSNFLGPMAGLIMPSMDRVGRPFPLTIAAPLAAADTAIITDSPDWFLALEQAALAGCADNFTPDELAVLLMALPAPALERTAHRVTTMCFWTKLDNPVEVSLADPEAALAHLLGPPGRSLETGQDKEAITS